MLTAPVQSQLQELPNYHRSHAGRKKKPGTIDFDKVTGRVARVLGYCPECHAKVLASREDIDALKLEYRRTTKSLRFRIFMRLANRYKDE